MAVAKKIADGGGPPAVDPGILPRHYMQIRALPTVEQKT